MGQLKNIHKAINNFYDEESKPTTIGEYADDLYGRLLDHIYFTGIYYIGKYWIKTINSLVEMESNKLETKLNEVKENFLFSKQYFSGDWIPRSVQEPPCNIGHLLITVKWKEDDYEVMEEDWAITKSEVEDGTATQVVQEIYKRTIAWMPMPEPYMEDK